MGHIVSFVARLGLLGLCAFLGACATQKFEEIRPVLRLNMSYQTLTCEQMAKEREALGRQLQERARQLEWHRSGEGFATRAVGALVSPVGALTAPLEDAQEAALLKGDLDSLDALRVLDCDKPVVTLSHEAPVAIKLAPMAATPLQTWAPREAAGEELFRTFIRDQKAGGVGRGITPDGGAHLEPVAGLWRKVLWPDRNLAYLVQPWNWDLLDVRLSSHGLLSAEYADELTAVESVLPLVSGKTIAILARYVNDVDKPKRPPDLIGRWFYFDPRGFVIVERGRYMDGGIAVTPSLFNARGNKLCIMEITLCLYAYQDKSGQAYLVQFSPDRRNRYSRVGLVHRVVVVAEGDAASAIRLVLLQVKREEKILENLSKAIQRSLELEAQRAEDRDREYAKCRSEYGDGSSQCKW